MQKIYFFITICLFSILSISAQGPVSKIDLPFLKVQDQSIEHSFEEVSKYISGKPNGMLYPVSKVKFIQDGTGFQLEIEGIDNSWRNLFKQGEVSYGYVIVRNRLFVIMGSKSETIDLNTIFYVAGGTKSFNKMQLPSTTVIKNPKWFYDYKNSVSTKIKVEDLDVLDK